MSIGIVAREKVEATGSTICTAYPHGVVIADYRVLDLEQLLGVLHLALVLVDVRDDLRHLGDSSEQVLVVKVVLGRVLHDLFEEERVLAYPLDGLNDEAADVLSLAAFILFALLN